MAPKKGAPEVKAEPKKRARTEPKHEEHPEDLETSSMDKLALQKQLLLEHIGEYDILMPLNLSNNDFESYS